MKKTLVEKRLGHPKEIYKEFWHGNLVTTTIPLDFSISLDSKSKPYPTRFLNLKETLISKLVATIFNLCPNF